MSKWIRKGDRVLVNAGNDKGKAGEVLQRLEDRVVVQGVNIRKKHLRPNQQAPGGRIVEMECPIHISNVTPCDKENNRLKLAVQITKDGGKNLVYTSGGKEVIYRAVKKGK
jgi:large subunit ribosomal protein L24